MATESAAGKEVDPGGTRVEDAPEGRIWNRTFITVFVANALVSIGLQMSNVLIGKYTDSLGATATLVGVVSSAFAWSAIVFKLFSGPTLDAFNRKYVVMAAISVIGFAFVGYGFAANVGQLISFRLLQGAGQAFTTTCFIAMAADSLPRKKMGTGLGFFALAAGISQMVGPVISLKVQEAFDYNIVFFLAAIVIAVALLAATQIKLEYRPAKKFSLSPKSIIAPEALVSASLLILLISCYCLVNPFLAIFAEGRGIGSDISYFFTIYAGVLFVSRPLSGKLADKFGYMVLVPMFGLFVAAFFLISLASALWMFLAASILFGFGYGGAQPVLQSMAMRMVPKSRRGAASSTNFIGSDIGNIVGPIVGGSIAHTFGYTAMWQLMPIALVAAAVLVIALRKVITRNIETAAQIDAAEPQVAVATA